MEILARPRSVLTYARGITVLALLMVAALAFPTSAHAASAQAAFTPNPFERTTVGLVRDKASGAVAAAATYCVLSSSLPSLYTDPGGGRYVVGSGEYRCNNPVNRIDLHIDVYRDNSIVLSRDSSAQPHPGYKLYSLTSILGPSCVPGTYYWDVTGYVNNGALGSGRVRSSVVSFNC